MISEYDFLKQFHKTMLDNLLGLEEKTAETMAKSVYSTCVDFCKNYGQNPDYEVFIKPPGEARHFDDLTCWVVAWEAGPYEWAIPASMDITFQTGKVVDAYYSFDLCFYPSEDKYV